MFELMDAYSQSAVIKVIGVGGGGGNAVSHMVIERHRRRGFHLRQHRCAGAEGLEDQDLAADRRQHHQGTRRGRRSGDRPPGRDGGSRSHHRADRGLRHAVHHRRHGRRHRHRRGAGGGADCARARHPHRRGGHQAVPDGRQQALDGGRPRHRGADQERRFADHDPESEAADGARAPAPRCSTPSRPPTRCCRARCRASPS